MGLGLTKLGEKVLNGCCEEAWHRVDRDELNELASQLKGVSHYIHRVYRRIRDVQLNFSRYSRYLLGLPADIHALILYEHIKPGKDNRRTNLRNFGRGSLELLEYYLVHKRFLDEDSWEDEF